MAGADSTIMLPAGTYTLIRPALGANGPDGGDLNLTSPLSGNPVITVSGAGAASTIIDANGIDRVFRIEGARQAVISGVTITHGSVSSSGGGGIYNGGASLVLFLLRGATGSYGPYLRLGAVYVAGARDAVAVRQLGFVPIGGIGAGRANAAPVIFAASLPKTISGKVRRVELKHHANRPLQDALAALSASKQAVQPKNVLDPFIYFDDGSVIDTNSNILTTKDGTQIDITTGVKVIDTSSIMQLANGAYLDTKNNILTLPDGTQIDTVTGLKISVTA